MPSSQPTWPSSFQCEVNVVAAGEDRGGVQRALHGLAAGPADGARRRGAMTGRSSALLGMQAQYEHSPPTSSLSTTAVVSPAARARSATFSPTGPGPEHDDVVRLLDGCPVSVMGHSLVGWC